MMGVFAEFERAMIQERVRAGLARAKDAGKRLGRPPLAADIEGAIRKALATPGRPGVRKIAEAVRRECLHCATDQCGGAARPFRRRKRGRRASMKERQ
jgi:DNA invertase Pin-like site-specific DNA recombinase